MSFLPFVLVGAVSSLNNWFYPPDPEEDNTKRANRSLASPAVLELICRTNPAQFRALRRVNRHFNRAALQVASMIVNKKKIGAAIWARYIGDVGGVGVEPPFPDRYKMLVATTERVVAHLMPPTVNGRPHTPDLFNELAKNPKEGEPTGYFYYSLAVKERYGSVAVRDPYWVVIDREVLEGSLGKTRTEQLAMARSAGGEAPTYHEMTVAAVMHFLVTGEMMLGRDPIRYTECKEEPINGCYFVVGGFGHSREYGRLGFSIGNFVWNVGIVVRRS